MPVPSSLRLKQTQEDQSEVNEEIYEKSALPNFLNQEEKKLPSTLKPKKEEEEGWGKWFLRSLSQIPIGLAEATPYGIFSNLFSFFAMGEMLDENGIDELRRAAEKSGIPFDEEAYRRAAGQILEGIPTPSNLARMGEELTGLPLEDKTNLQKALRFGSMASKFAPSGYTVRPLNIPLPKPLLGGAVTAVREGLLQSGFPEPIADLASFLVLKQPKNPKYDLSQITFGKKEKPSGMIERRFESITEPQEISGRRKEIIGEKLESDFRNISDRIILESPIEQTHTELLENPTFKSEIAENFKVVENLAEQIPETLHTNEIKKTLVDRLMPKKGTGFAPTEYDKDFRSFIKEFIKETPPQEISAKDLVTQYRKNNKALGESFDPSRTKAYNRAKTDAILEYNRAIAESIEKKFPNSEFSNLFKETNEQWTKISDAEAINKFVDDIFTERGINFDKAKRVFDNKNYQRIFNRSLGKEGFEDFKQLVKDFTLTQRPYSMLKVAKRNGWNELYDLGTTYMFSKTLGRIRTGIKFGRTAYKGFMNALLDKPKLGFNWKRAVKDLEKGNFGAAETEFKNLDKEIKAHEGEIQGKVRERQKQAKIPREETIEVNPEKIEQPKKELGFEEPKPKWQEPKELKGPRTPELIEYKPKPEEKLTETKPIKEKPKKLSKQGESHLFGKKEKPKKLSKEESIQKKQVKEKQKTQKQIEKLETLLRERKVQRHLEPKNQYNHRKITQIENDLRTLKEKIHSEQPGEKIEYKSEKMNQLQTIKKSSQEIIKDLKEDLSIAEEAHRRAYGENKTDIFVKIDKIEKALKDTQQRLENAEKKIELEKEHLKMRKEFLSEKEIIEEKKSTESKTARPDISKEGLKKQKQFILNKIDDALKHPTENQYVRIDVPGDGNFKIFNRSYSLEKFRDKVEKKWPIRDLPGEAKIRKQYKK